MMSAGYANGAVQSGNQQGPGTVGNVGFQLQQLQQVQPAAISIKAKGPQAEQAIMWNGINQAAGTGANMLTSMFNYLNQSDAIDANAQIAKEYYETSADIAEAQAEVAVKQLEVQDNALYVQADMQREMNESNERMKKTEGYTQRAIVAEQEKGKTDRARVVAATGAFENRNSWNLGEPAMFDVVPGAGFIS